jgi:hypothetical protein
MAAKPLALAKKAPSPPGIRKPRVSGGREPDAPTNSSFKAQVSKVVKQGYELGDAEDIVKEQFALDSAPLEFSKGGLVGSKIKVPKMPKPKAIKVARMSTSMKAPAAPKAKAAKVVK